MLYAVRACAEGVALYPVYALLFADRGLTMAETSSLFALWSVVAFVCEVPSGALADAWSRRKLYALGEALTAAGFALWLIWPSYPGFALGFVLWGIGGSLGSGSLEALVYDELAADGRSDAYARVIGRSGTVAILAMLAATLLATPALTLGDHLLNTDLGGGGQPAAHLSGADLPGIGASAGDPADSDPADSDPQGVDRSGRGHAGAGLMGGYLLVGALSIAVKLIGAGLALRLPETRGDEDDEPGYGQSLRDGIREVIVSRPVAWAAVAASLVPGFTALDEYLPLLSREKGAATTAVPLLFGLTALAMAAGSAAAARLTPAALRVALPTAALLIAAGALTPHLAGMVAIAVAFGLLQLAMVLTETHLQNQITGSARSTVLSVAGFASEVFAVGLYAVFALNVPLPALVALTAVPLLLTVLTIRRT